MSRIIIQQHSHHYYSVLPPSLSNSHPKLNQQQQFAMFATKHMVYSSCTTSNRRRGFKTKAIEGNPSSLLLGVATARPGDVSVLLQTSAVMLFAYWIANFVVPDIVIKDFKNKKEENDADDNGDNRS